MARGSADFSNVQNIGIAYSVADNWESINRPRGALSVDLRGHCILYNDFEDGTANAAEINNAVPVYSGIARNNVFPGNFAFQLSTAATANKNCGIRFGLPYDVADKIGLEGIIYCNDDNTKIFITLYRFTGTVQVTGQIRFDTHDGKTYILNSAGNYVDISSIVTHDFPRSFYQNIKLVCDYVTGYYSRLIINGRIYDISSYQLWSTNFVQKPAIRYEFLVETIEAVSHTMYVDNILITANEP